MICEDITLKIYCYLANDVNDDERCLIEQHLGQCEVCRKKVEEYENVLELLDQLQPPPPSKGFEERVLQRLHSLPMPKKPLGQRLQDFFMERLSIPPFPWRAVAVTAAILIMAPIVTYYMIKGPDSIDRDKAMPAIQIGSAPIPIAIVTKDPDRAFAQLKSIAQAHGGQVTQSTPTEKQIRVVVKVPPNEERVFVKALSSIGKIRDGLFLEDEAYKGFKDDKGNMIISLEKEEPPSPPTR
jgi:hypothetical protein